jgi:hypothetical protein
VLFVGGPEALVVLYKMFSTINTPTRKKGKGEWERERGTTLRDEMGDEKSKKL